MLVPHCFLTCPSIWEGCWGCKRPACSRFVVLWLFFTSAPHVISRVLPRRVPQRPRCPVPQLHCRGETNRLHRTRSTEVVIDLLTSCFFPSLQSSSPRCAVFAVMCCTPSHDMFNDATLRLFHDQLGDQLNDAPKKGEVREAHRLSRMLAGRRMGARRRNLTRIPDNALREEQRPSSSPLTKVCNGQRTIFSNEVESV